MVDVVVGRESAREQRVGRVRVKVCMAAQMVPRPDAIVDIGRGGWLPVGVSPSCKFLTQMFGFYDGMDAIEEQRRRVTGVGESLKHFVHKLL